MQTKIITSLHAFLKQMVKALEGISLTKAKRERVLAQRLSQNISFKS